MFRYPVTTSIMTRATIAMITLKLRLIITPTSNPITSGRIKGINRASSGGMDNCVYLLNNQIYKFNRILR